MATSLGRDAESRRSTNVSLKFLLTAVMTAAAATPANAQNWEMEPFVELVATYTDNLYLGVEGTEVSSFIGQVNPGISLRKREGRFTLSSYYRAQGLVFSESSDLNTVYHQLDMDGTLDVVSERFFVDFDASIDQSVIDPSESIPVSNVVATENLGDVYVGNVNPYFIQPVGGNTYLRLDYAHGIGRYDGFGLETFSRVDDFSRDEAGFYLGTGLRESGFEWSLTYDDQQIDYENVEDFRLERAQLAIGVPITRQFRLVGMVGQESDLIADRQVGGLDSDFWEVGFRVNAGPRKSFEVRTGERFFGTSYFGNLEFEGRRINMTLSYSENPTTSALGDLGSLIIPFGPDSDTADPVEPTEIEDTIIGPIRAEVYISKSTRARIELTGNRSVLYVAYYDEDREFLDEAESLLGPEDGQTSATAGLAYEIGPRTDLDVSLTRLNYDYADTETSTRVLQGILGLVRRLGRESELRFAYRHVFQETDSVSDFDNYTESAIDISLLKRF